MCTRGEWNCIFGSYFKIMSNPLQRSVCSWGNEGRLQMKICFFCLFFPLSVFVCLLFGSAVQLYRGFYLYSFLWGILCLGQHNTTEFGHLGPSSNPMVGLKKCNMLIPRKPPWIPANLPESLAPGRCSHAKFESEVKTLKSGTQTSNLMKTTLRRLHAVCFSLGLL